MIKNIFIIFVFLDILVKNYSMMLLLYLIIKNYKYLIKLFTYFFMPSVLEIYIFLCFDNLGVRISDILFRGLTMGQRVIVEC